MPTLTLDLETYSSNNIKKCGAYKYTQAPDFEILMLAYAFDNEPVQVIDLWDDLEEAWLPIPEFLVKALYDPTIEKRAYNSSFELACLNNHINTHRLIAGNLITSQWVCTMAHASLLSLPLGLDRCAAALRLPVTKDPAGKALIKYFCEPCKPTKTNGMRTRNLPYHDYEKWERFKEYCKKDVIVEREIDKKLEFLQPTSFERKVWLLDQKINNHGVLIDEKLVSEALRINRINANDLMAEARGLTGLSNPNSTSQLLAWLSEETAEDVENLRKDTVTNMLTGLNSDEVTRVLQIRQELSKSSLKKYAAMAAGLGFDGRIRGLLQYGGAARTMRFCLAEGSLVLVKTAEGEVLNKPIESVLISDLVFDGNSWVTHEGVVFSGNKTVIEWDGVRATCKHKVFISETKKVTLQYARKHKLPLWKGNTRSID